MITYEAEAGRYWLAAAVRLPLWLARVAPGPILCVGFGLRGADSMARMRAQRMAERLYEDAAREESCANCRL